LKIMNDLRQRDRCWEVLWWSHRDKWESIGDMGGVVFDTVEEAAEYVLDDPMGLFWREAGSMGRRDHEPLGR
jgi:hypothetical protein